MFAVILKHRFSVLNAKTFFLVSAIKNSFAVFLHTEIYGLIGKIPTENTTVLSVTNSQIIVP